MKLGKTESSSDKQVNYYVFSGCLRGSPFLTGESSAEVFFHYFFYNRDEPVHSSGENA